MGAWGYLAFENDDAADWSYALEKTADLSLVESALDGAIGAEDEYLECDLGSHALAACEVLARLRGQPGDANASTETVDAWIAKHPIVPSAEILARASLAIDRVLADDSELRDQWEESEGWRAAVEDLRRRLHA